jgi:hypothetical protein
LRLKPLQPCNIAVSAAMAVASPAMIPAFATLPNSRIMRLRTQERAVGPMPAQGSAASVSRCTASRRHPAGTPARLQAASFAAARARGTRTWGDDLAATGPAGARHCSNRDTGARRAAKVAGTAGQILGQGLGAGSAAGAYAAVSLHYLAGEILAAAGTAVFLATVVVLLAVTVFGSTEHSNRVFRILRWVRGKEEPPEPPGS